MLKKHLTMIMLAMVLVMSSISVQAASNIDTSNVKNGVINISFKSLTNATTAVRVSKGNEKKDHVFKDKVSLPLQFGEGEYTIIVLEQASAKGFRTIESQKVNFNPKNKNDIYLQSIQMVNWNKDMNAIKKAKEITKNAKTDKEKVTAIYNYVVSNIKYDNAKALGVKPGYISSMDLTLETGQGICYDYAALFAGMTRSLNIPTKLIEGRKNDIEDYHAWNQVYLKETNEWIIIDTTYDAAYKKANQAINMIKDIKEYKAERQY